MNGTMIYADHAATTKLHEDVLRVMLPYLTENYGNPSAKYAYGRKAAKAVSNARKTIADCIGAKSSEIFFTSCGTEGDNWILHGTKGDVFTSKIEHHAVLNTCDILKENERCVNILPVDHKGLVSTEKLEELIKKRYSKNGLVSVMMANNEIGTIEPVKELADIAHRNGCLFMTDAVQCVGHIPIDVRELDVDFLTASAHKFNGPKGIGFIYVKEGCSLMPYITGGGQEKSMRAGTENVAFIVGMAEALRINTETICENTKQLRKMEEIFIEVLEDKGIDYIRNGSSNHLPGLISLSIKGVKGETIQNRMDIKGICISTGSACDSERTKLSHVIEAIGVDDTYSWGTVRVSFGYDNTADEVVAVARELAKIVTSIKVMTARRVED